MGLVLAELARGSILLRTGMHALLADIARTRGTPPAAEDSYATNYTPPWDHQWLYICSWIAPARQKCHLIIISALNSPEVLVVVVAVVEERESRDLAVGGTAEDEEEGEGVVDSAAVREKRKKSITRLLVD